MLKKISCSLLALTLVFNPVPSLVNNSINIGVTSVSASAEEVATYPTLEVSGEGETELRGLRVVFTPNALPNNTGTVGRTVSATVDENGELYFNENAQLYVGVSYDVTITTRFMHESYLTLNTAAWIGGGNNTIINITSDKLFITEDNRVNITITDLPAGTWKVNLSGTDVSALSAGSSEKTLTTNGDATFEFRGLSYATSGIRYNVHIAQIVNGVELNRMTFDDPVSVVSENVSGIYAYQGTVYDNGLKGDGVGKVEGTAPTTVTVNNFSATNGTVGQVKITDIETVSNSSYATIVGLMTFDVQSIGDDVLTIDLSNVLTNNGYQLAVFEKTSSSDWNRVTATSKNNSTTGATTYNDMSITFPVQNGAKYTLAYVSTNTGNTSTSTTFDKNSNVSVRVNGSYISELQNVIYNELVNLNNITTISGNPVVGWYYDSALTQEITNANAFLIDSNAVNNGVFVKFGSITPESNTDLNVNTQVQTPTQTPIPTPTITHSAVPATGVKLLGKLF